MTHRVQVRERFGDVDTQSILPVFIRRWEETDQVEVQRASSRIEGQRKRVVAVRSIDSGYQFENVLCPLTFHRLGCNIDRAKHIRGQAGL